jgi:SAM-dependent methyltransferase
MTLYRDVAARTASYERELLEATRTRVRSAEDYIRCQMLIAEPLVRRMRPLLPAGRARILEVGCGTGGISLHLATQGFDVTAVDREQYDPEALAAARQFAHRANIHLNVCLTDGAALPFRAGTYDAVVCANVVEHLEDPPATMAEIYRVLVLGGVAFVDFPLFHSPYGGHIDDVIKIPWFHLLHRRWVEAELQRRGAERARSVFLTLNGITSTKFRRIVDRLGFDIVSLRRAHFVTHPGRKLIISILEAARHASARRAWRAIREAALDFSLVELLQFPFLMLTVPLSYVPAVGEYFAAGVGYALRKPAAPEHGRDPGRNGHKRG